MKTPNNPCLTLEQAIRVKLLTDKLNVKRNIEKRKRVNAIEAHQERRSLEELL
jgi:hypothetical protein